MFSWYIKCSPPALNLTCIRHHIHFNLTHPNLFRRIPPISFVFFKMLLIHFITKSPVLKYVLLHSLLFISFNNRQISQRMFCVLCFFAFIRLLCSLPNIYHLFIIPQFSSYAWWILGNKIIIIIKLIHFTCMRFSYPLQHPLGGTLNCIRIPHPTTTTATEASGSVVRLSCVVANSSSNSE